MAYRWKGKDGQFVDGVPATDLSDDDIAAMAPNQRQILDDYLAFCAANGMTPLYEQADQTRAEVKADAKVAAAAKKNVDTAAAAAENT